MFLSKILQVNHVSFFSRLFVVKSRNHLLLKHIPMAALYGVFMFMGVSALHGMQVSETPRFLTETDRIV